jgi:hypothetical protein
MAMALAYCRTLWCRPAGTVVQASLAQAGVDAGHSRSRGGLVWSRRGEARVERRGDVPMEITGWERRRDV